MSLVAEHLCHRWEPGGPEAVRDLSLALAPGELLAVVGPNGSGKSTLLALLAGWLRPVSGRVVLEGRPLETLRPGERARSLAYLPQQVAPLYDLTVAELAATGRYPWGGPVPGSPVDDPSVARALTATGLDALASRPFGTLSGGERQRALLASVLAQETRWMLLDEPTAALDLHHAVTIFHLLGEAAAGGRGVLVVTHDLNLASLHATRIALLSGGTLEAVGPPEAVLTTERLERAYGPEVLVSRHPETGRPAVLPRRGGGR